MSRTKRYDRPDPDHPTNKALTRPEVYEARRLGAAELFAQGRRPAEVAEMVGVTYEAARRWRARWRKGGVQALRRRRPGGRPPKLSATQATAVKQALEAGAQAAGFDTDLWTLDRVAQVIQATTGVRLSRPSAWRLLTQRLGWSLQRPERQAKSVTRRRSPAGWPTSGRGSKRGRRKARMASLFRRVGHLAAAGDPPGLVTPGGDPDPAASLQREAGLHGRGAWRPRQRPHPRAAAVLPGAQRQLRHRLADRGPHPARRLLRRRAGGAAGGRAGWVCARAQPGGRAVGESQGGGVGQLRRRHRRPGRRHRRAGNPPGL